ncbi:uncharacterized protein JCM6883_001702 [Sporobolomyces salmoneus]|uniref:uncharacterized protein n=1 Tax=Sporobolomyces salmoneus TaxID=183962 RepID=UPI00317CCB1A
MIAALVAKDSLDTIISTTVLLAVHGVLFGYFLTEIGIYFNRFPHDRVGFRVLVYWLTIAQIVYIAVKIGNFITMVDRVLDNLSIYGDRLWLTFAPVLVTTSMEATAEGFFCWRLCAVSNKLWMKTIAVLLWTFSTTSHIIWVSMLGVAWQLTTPDVPDPPRLRILLLMSFWGTAVQNIWISSCLIFELAFSRDRKALKGSTNSGNISKLVSLAMRTSAILIVFELLVAIIVSVGNQDEVALAIETSFSTAIYTVLSSIVVLHTLNYRTRIREASPNFSSPIFFAPSKKPSSSGSGGILTNTTETTRGGGIGSGTKPGTSTDRADEPIRSDDDQNPREETKSERKKKGLKRKSQRELGQDSGTGITVQTISWVREEERTNPADRQEDKTEMVIERGKKDLASRTYFLRP